MRALTLAVVFLLAGALPDPAGAQQGERIDVLIQFHAAPTPTDLRAVTAAGGQISFTYRIVPAIAASVPEQALAGLRANPRIAVVEPDSLLYALEYRSTHDWGIGHINADDVHRAATPNTGAGISVAVIDSGIDCDHLELPQDRCDYGQTWGWNFVNNTHQADDDWGHGTHVSGTIAAALNDTIGGVVGVAPSATVISMKTLDDSGSGAWSRHIAAIDRVWNGGTPIAQVVNMSIGRGDYSSTAETAMNRAYESGILLVAAAGNGGNCGGKGDNVSYPAAFDSVIAVAAIDGSNTRPCWSSTGPKVELAAPGVSVFSTWPADMSTSYRDPQPVCEDGDGDGQTDDCHYKYGSGTSMSSPHVAGAAALVLASGDLSDTSGSHGLADELRQRLADTAVDLGSSGRDPQYGHGLVDAAAAVGLGGGGDDGGGSDPGSGISLSASGRRVAGRHTVDLSWTDSTGLVVSDVDIFRNGSLITATPNDGAYTDSMETRGGASYTYQVCHPPDPSTGATLCSNEASVEF